MKRFFLMFWNDNAVFERFFRVLIVGGGAALTAVEGPPLQKMIGAGLMATGVAIGAGDKNPKTE